MATEQGSAEAKLRGDDIVIVAKATLGAGGVTDWDAFVQRLGINDSHAYIGATLRTCLLRSRTMSSEWMRAHMGATDYSARLANAFGLPSTRALYPGMRNASVNWAMGQVRFGPTRNLRGGSFGGFEIGADRGHEDILISFEVADEELGWALLEALRRSL